jgi:hypothetical protein
MAKVKWSWCTGALMWCVFRGVKRAAMVMMSCSCEWMLDRMNAIYQH